MPEILKHLKVLHIGQVEAKELLRQEIIGKAGLTPTDLMHVEGSHTPWDTEAAALALEVFATTVQARVGDAEPIRPCVQPGLAAGHRDGRPCHRHVSHRQEA